MLCQVCNKNEATIHLKSHIDGKESEKFLCPKCAGENNFAETGAKFGFEPIDMIDGFFGKNADGLFGGLFAGMMNDTYSKGTSNVKACPVCGMRFSEFLNGGKIGCAECYNVFSSSLGSTIKRVHGNIEHCGKVPAGESDKKKNEKQIASLKEKLRHAIDEQEYEMAAKYRDEIRALEKKNSTSDGEDVKA